MFGLRCWIDCHPRTKNGQPAQSTTGVASANCSQDANVAPSDRSMGRPGNMSPIATTSNGTVRATPTQNRRVMSASSGFSPSSRVTVFGSSAIPQIGHEPGATRTISGCIGHTHSVLLAAGAGATGSSVIPHFGHVPGPACRTSGCMGQV